MSKSWLAWGAVAGAVGVMALAACSSSDSGASGPSAGAGGGTGGTDAGTGGTPDAGEAGGTGGTSETGGAAGSAGTGGTVEPPDAGGQTFLGAWCTSNDDCAPGFCLLPGGDDIYGFAGPAGGYCTLDCTDYANDYTLPDPCAAASPSASCVPIAQSGSTITKAVCFEGCTLGEPPVDGINNVLDTSKCHGRNDAACIQPTDDVGNPVGTPYCQPLCQRDTNCASAGRKCDPRLKLCVDEANLTQGLPMGSSCSEWVQSEGDAGNACSGLCLGLRKSSTQDAGDPDNVAYFCTERCVYNTITGCGYQDSPPGGVCLIASANDGAGDVGYCLQMCDVDSDCGAYGDPVANVYCDPIGVQNGWGRGFCLFHYGQAEAGAFPCANNTLDGDETDVDCGGSCSKCAGGKTCAQNSDCASNSCADPGDGGPLVCAP